MKKLLTFLLCIVLVLSFVACGNDQNTARDAVLDICEQFMDYEISASECREKLEGMYLPAPEDGSFNHLKSDVNYLVFCLMKEDYGDFTERYERIKGHTY